MSKKMALLAATALMTVSTLAFADDSAQDKSKVEYKDNGGYVSTQSSEQTNPDGSTVKSGSSEDVDLDSNGLGKKTNESHSKTSAAVSRASGITNGMKAKPPSKKKNMVVTSKRQSVFTKIPMEPTSLIKP